MSTAERPVRDCTHPRVKHAHGTVQGYRQDGCRCEPCRAAASAQMRAYRVARHTGRNNYQADVDRVREHMVTMRDKYGVTPNTVTKAAGVSTATAWRIMHGKAKISRAVGARILRVNLDSLPDTARMNSLGARRRLQALCAVGWPIAELGRRIGFHNPLHILDREQAEVGTVRAVAALYRELLGVDPDPVVGRRWAEAARRRAAKNGWAPPGAWHDIDHDDAPEPDAPELEDEATPTLNAASVARARRREDAVDLIAGGFAPDVVRERLQIKGPVTELYRLLREAGRDDLVAVAELDHQIWKDQAA